MLAKQLVVRPFVADQAASLEQLVDDRCAKRSASLGRVEPLGVEHLGNPRCRVATFTKFHHAVHERLKIAELGVGRNGPNDLMLTFIAAGPVDRHIDEFTVASDLHHYTLYKT